MEWNPNGFWLAAYNLSWNSQQNLVNNKILHKKMIAGKLQLDLLRMKPVRH